MSSIYLKKDYDGQKAGTIISVPFGVGKSLIKSGVGDYPTDEQRHKPVMAEHGHAQAAQPKAEQPKADAKVPHGPGGKGTEVKGADVPQFPPQPTPATPPPHETKKK